MRRHPIDCRSALRSCNKRRNWLVGAILYALMQHQAIAGSVVFRWDYTASGAAGFMLHCGGSSRNYTTHVDTGNTDTYTIGTLQEGSTVYCAVTAYDASRTQSAYSNEVTAVVPTTTVTSGGGTPASYSLWPTAVPANPAEADSSPVNLGVKFTTAKSGYIKAIRFYKSTQNTGAHVGVLWTSGGQKLGQAAFANETASGWQTATFASPIPIAANTIYVASYFAPAGHYANDDNYFSTAATNGPLTALQNGVSGANGVYAYGTTPIMPTLGYQSTNYWVDVVFVPQ